MIGIIGGTSLQKIDDLRIDKKTIVRTPFGMPSSPILYGQLHGQSVVFLARHGQQHTIPPHLINYRANIWAMHHVGCQEIFAFSAMCSITNNMLVGDLVIPDQLIDYTWNRQSTFFNSQVDKLRYKDFAEPYAATTREKLLSTATQYERYHSKAIYGVTEGPRYETNAEVKRYQNDGCDLLGMTGMPEAGLAHEIGINYAVCGLVTNNKAQPSTTASKTQSEEISDANNILHGFLSRMFG